MHRSYKNIYRDPMIFGLPGELFWIFLGMTLVVVFLLILIQSYIVALLGVAFLGGLYGMVYVLVERHGRYFFKKLISYYTDQGFTVVRKNRSVRKLLK